MSQEPSRVTALTVDPSTSEVLVACDGADAWGECPRVEPGTVVPCAGHVLFAAAPSVDWYLRLEVGERARTCPLRAFTTAT
jgi:hypothetical protein